MSTQHTQTVIIRNKFQLVSNFTELLTLTPATHSHALLLALPAHCCLRTQPVYKLVGSGQYS